MDRSVIWIAKFDTPNTENYAAGRSPEESLSALIDIWKKSVSLHRGDPEYIYEIRDAIKVMPIPLGSGIALGTTDELWPDDAMAGDDERLSDVWEKQFPKMRQASGSVMR